MHCVSTRRAAISADVGTRLHVLDFGVTRTRTCATPSALLRNTAMNKFSRQLCVNRWYRAADVAGVLCAHSKRAITVRSGDSGGPVVASHQRKLRRAEEPWLFLVSMVSDVLS